MSHCVHYPTIRQSLDINVFFKYTIYLESTTMNLLKLLKKEKNEIRNGSNISESRQVFYDAKKNYVVSHGKREIKLKKLLLIDCWYDSLLQQETPVSNYMPKTVDE